MADDNNNAGGDDKNGAGNSDNKTGNNNAGGDRNTGDKANSNSSLSSKNNGELTKALRERDELKARLERLEEESKSDRERELDKARKQASEQARSETLSAANARILKSELKAQAAGKLADPSDVIRFLDLDSFSITDDGEVDQRKIEQSIEQLLKDKPYLAANAGKSKHGDVNQGVRKPTSNTSMNDLIRSKMSNR